MFTKQQRNVYMYVDLVSAVVYLIMVSDFLWPTTGVLVGPDFTSQPHRVDKKRKRR